ncbi:MAG: hypothetical protein ACT4PY_01410 [Armatimonadota bacterium]
MRWASILLAIVMLGAMTHGAGAQAGAQLVITMAVAGTLQDRGGTYYIAMTVSDSLLAGPQPDSTNWTHYVAYRQGRFFFGTVPPTVTQPFGFYAIRPPAPFLYGQASADRRTLRVSVPLTDLQVSASVPSRVLINFVTVNDSNRTLDALGPGASDRLGFVTVELRRDLFMTVRDPQGDAPDPNFDITGGEIRIATP